MTVKVKARVQAGMAWLDREYPDHVQRVDLDLLSVQEGECCPLAQAAGYHYGDAVRTHCLSDERVTELGFNAPWWATEDGLTELRALTAEWREQYGERLESLAQSRFDASQDGADHD